MRMIHHREKLRVWPAALLLAGVLAGCGGGSGAPGAKQIVWIQYFDVPVAEQCREGFVSGLPATGLREGIDYVLTIKSAQGDIGTLNSLLADARDRQVDLIVTSSTPVQQAAMRQISAIPVVALNADPQRIAGDSGMPVNMTGAALIGDFAGMVALIREVLPQARRVGTVFSPAEDNSVLFLTLFSEAAAAQGLTVVSRPAAASTDVPEAARALAAQPLDLICQISDNASATAFAALVDAARARQLPLFSFAADQAASGAMLTFSRDCVAAGRDAAGLAAQILRGTPPRELPVVYSSRSRLNLNLRAAAACGIAIPAAVADRADTVIR